MVSNVLSRSSYHGTTLGRLAVRHSHAPPQQVEADMAPLRTRDKISGTMNICITIRALHTQSFCPLEAVETLILCQLGTNRDDNVVSLRVTKEKSNNKFLWNMDGLLRSIAFPYLCI